MKLFRRGDGKILEGGEGSGKNENFSKEAHNDNKLAHSVHSLLITCVPFLHVV